MTYEIDKAKLDIALKKMYQLENLLDERISDLHEVKGGMQSRHAYIFYREKLKEAREIIIENKKYTD